jgi:Cu/Ag efflux protein CusF
MRKVVGLGLALVLALPLAAAADGIKGTIKTVDPADHSIVLEDGTKLWVSEDRLTDLSPGEQVQAVFETQGGKRLVTDLEHRVVGSDGQETTNFFSHGASPISEIQSGD